MAEALLPTDVWHLVASHVSRLAPLVPLLPTLDWRGLAVVKVQAAWRRRPRITHNGQRVSLLRRRDAGSRWRLGTVVDAQDVDLPLVLMDSRFAPNYRYVFVCRRTYLLRIHSD